MVKSSIVVNKISGNLEERNKNSWKHELMKLIFRESDKCVLLFEGKHDANNYQERN